MAAPTASGSLIHKILTGAVCRIRRNLHDRRPGQRTSHLQGYPHEFLLDSKPTCRNPAFFCRGNSPRVGFWLCPGGRGFPQRLWTNLGLLTLAGLVACPGPRRLADRMSWGFADRRPCDEAGVTTLAVVIGGETVLTQDCAARPIDLGSAAGRRLSPNDFVVVEGRSAAGTVLYRGIADPRVEGAAGAHVTLVYVGGSPRGSAGP